MKIQVGMVAMVGCSFLLGGAVAAEEASEAPSRNPAYLAPMDAFNLEFASDPRMSPDGRRVAYVRRWNDVMTDKTRSNIWIVDSDGANHRPVASGRVDYGSPRWSPDGSRLAYVSSEEGSPQIYVRWMDTGDTALVTNLTAAPRDLAWSPDGRSIAFVMDVPLTSKPLVKTKLEKPENAEWNEPFKVIEAARFRQDGEGFYDPRRAHIFIAPADGGAPRQLTSGDFNHDGPISWTPDGAEIVFASNRHENWELETIESDLFSVAINGALKQLTDEPGAESAPVVSPDGTRIAFLKTPNRPLAYQLNRLMTMPVDGGSATRLSADFNRDVEAPRWAADGSGIYFAYDDRGARHAGFMTLSGERRQIAKGLGGESIGRPYVSGEFSVSRDGAVVFTGGAPDRPADLVMLRNGATSRLTDLNSDALGHKKLGEVHEIVYSSSVDGTEIQGWYITPPDFDPAKKYPLVLEIHGGPHAAYSSDFSFELQRYAAEGYVVFYDNHRGSSSYGEEFGLLLQHKYPSKDDFGDHMSGVDAMIAKGFVDPDRLFITGGSAGGVATAYIVGLTDRFKAAVAAKPIINWTSKPLTADSYIYQTRHQFPGMPWEAFDHYWERSPLSLVGNVTTPTLLMTGEEDYRTPITESEQFYQALTLRGIDTALVRVPGSGHGIAGRPSRMANKVEHILAWFERYDPAKPEAE
ncbi:MAG: prolyl oligopeptidase family serine peptidase [Alphaproteobacteria bacterium]|nr:prolyl oligopeptidase family serine peptidase [Alphaproteobacteria bacterium]